MPVDACPDKNIVKQKAHRPKPVRDIQQDSASVFRFPQIT
jgi:hypothetical protein